jgi:hypothetical protein
LEVKNKTGGRMNKGPFTHINFTNDEEVIQMANNNGGTNNLLVPQANQALDQLKYEIASEFGVQLGADTTSRQNGSVGGEITKRLVSFAEQQLAGRA